MNKYFLLIICLSVTISACQKEISLEAPINSGGGGGNGGGGGSNANLIGIWKLSKMHAETVSENEIDLFGTLTRTVTTSAYDTKGNTGGFNFATDLKVTANIGYSIDTIGMVYTYENNVLEDSMEFDFNVPYTSSNSVSGYKLVGADSIYFTGGTISVGTGSNQNSKPTGMKYKIVGSTLTMDFHNTGDSTIDVGGGQLMKIKQRVSGIMTLIK